MFTHLARGKPLAVVAWLGVIVLLAICGTGIAAAAPLQLTSTPSPHAQPPPAPPANIPVYPGAKQQGAENANVNGHQATTWSYTVSNANVTLTDVASYYQQHMPANGWTQVQAVPPEDVQGTFGAMVLVYRQQSKAGTPTPTPGHEHQEMAIIAAGTNNQTNPHEIGFVITVVK